MKDIPLPKSGTFHGSDCVIFRRHVLEVHKSAGLGDMGFIRQPIAFCLLLVFGLVYLALWKGVKSTGKVAISEKDRSIFAGHAKNFPLM